MAARKAAGKRVMIECLKKKYNEVLKKAVDMGFRRNRKKNVEVKSGAFVNVVFGGTASDETIARIKKLPFVVVWSDGSIQPF